MLDLKAWCGLGRDDMQAQRARARGCRRRVRGQVWQKPQSSRRGGRGATALFGPVGAHAGPSRGDKGPHPPDKHFEWDWWTTISYSTLRRLLLIPLLLLVVALGTRYLVGLDREARIASAKREVAAAKRELSQLRGDAESRGYLVEWERAQELVAHAENSIVHQDYARARADAADARQKLRGAQAGVFDTGGRFVQVEGRVSVRRVGSLEWILARDSMVVNEGDLIRTASGSSAQIQSVSNDVHTVGPETTIKYERSSRDATTGRTKVAIEVSSGQVNVATARDTAPGSTNEVLTPNAQVSLGPATVARVGVHEGQDGKVDVYEGAANVAVRGQDIKVAKNEGLRVGATSFELNQLPDAPTLVTPPYYKVLLARELKGRPIELEWESIREARGYHIVVALSPLFTDLVSEVLDQPQTFLALKDPRQGDYYWRVAAVDRKGIEGSFSTPSRFRVSDVMPEGQPPALALSSIVSLGEGVILVEGKSQPGVYVTVDDGVRTYAQRAEHDGKFRKSFTVGRQGTNRIKVTARASNGLENTVEQSVNVRF